MRFCNAMFVICMILGLSACNSDEKAMEDLKSQTEMTSRSAIQEENVNLGNKAKAMEKELELKHRFFQGLKGRYEGSFQTEQGEFKIRVNLSPNIEPNSNITNLNAHRSLDVIASDLINLSMNVKIVQWPAASPLGLMECRIEGIKPNLATGALTINVENCKNFYHIVIAKTAEDFSVVQEEASDLAKDLISGSVNEIEFIAGEIQSNTNIFTFKAQKAN